MKKLKLSILIVLILLIGSYIGYTYPRSWVKEFEGIQYRIGESAKDYSNIVKIKFDGTFSKNFIFGNTFKGELYINDLRFYEDELKFDKFNRAFLISHQSKMMGENLIPSMLIIDSGFNKLVIAISERNSRDVGTTSSGYGWSVHDGLVIAAPAKNRNDAVSITSEIIAKSLLIAEAE